MFWKLLLLFSIELVFSTQIDYNDYKIFRVIPKTTEELKYLVDKFEHGTSEQASFWRDPSGLNKPVDILVSPHYMEKFIEIIRTSGIHYDKIIENVKNLILSEKLSNRRRKRDVNNFALDRYNTIEEINDWLNGLKKKYKHRLKVKNIGYSFNGQTIKGVKVTRGDNRTRRAIVIEGGIHAREWISPAVSLYLINQFLNNPDGDADVQRLADDYDWYIFPVINPDGYRYTHTHDRLWRKTRSRRRSQCIGVDANRNWGYQWRETPKRNPDNNECSNEYSGPSPFSEKETKAMSNYLLNLQSKYGENLIGYIALHSFAQAILLPYTYSMAVNPPDDQRTNEIANRAANAIRRRTNMNYTVTYSDGVIKFGLKTGSSIDWVKGVLELPYVFTLELRPSFSSIDFNRFNDYFLLETDQIIPTGNDVMAALISMFRDL